MRGVLVWRARVGAVIHLMATIWRAKTGWLTNAQALHAVDMPKDPPPGVP